MKRMDLIRRDRSPLARPDRPEPRVTRPHGEPERRVAATAEKKVFFRAVPVFDVSMTDPLPGKEPVPLLPPSQPITGDTHQHLIAPLIAHARELGYTVEIRDLPDRSGPFCGLRLRVAGYFAGVGAGGPCDPRPYRCRPPVLCQRP